MLSAQAKEFALTTKIGTIMGRPPIKSPQFGVEIEIEGRNLPAEVPGWEVHREGSLRGDAKEYVTDGSVSRRHLAVAMDNLAHVMMMEGSQPKPSYRAGVHCHYNMLDQTIDQVIRAIIRWNLVEPITMKLCGPERDGNHFCLPTYDQGDQGHWLNTLFKGMNNLNRFSLQQFARGKYAALNSDPIARFGTLEGRCFPCSLEKDKILEAADLMHDILADDGRTPAQILAQADDDPKAFLTSIYRGRDLPFEAISLLGFGVEHTFIQSVVYTDWMGG